MPGAAPGDDGVGVLGFQHLLLPRLVHAAFLHGEEARAALHALGAQREGGEHPPAIHDAAGGDDGDRNRRGNRRHERHSGQLADMSASFRALGHHGVGAEALHAGGQGRGGHHGHYLHARVLPHLHIVGGTAGAGGHHFHAQLAHELGHLARARIHEHDIDADRLARKGAGAGHLLANPFGPGAPAGDDAQAAGFAYGAGQPSVGDAGHGPLHDGIFNAQKLCDTGLHESSSSSLSLRQHAP